ncbi:hypothetical protein ACS127_08495 [Amphibacillus sp. Q70]|uniref:hypothetical protein n=1 Tax=Amphibacillus sp. Q70 TaxID=3453416 RepID=UPI003F83749B
MNCPECQAVNEPDAKFCVSCGVELNPVVEQDPPPPEDNEQTENVAVDEVEESSQSAEPNEFIEKTKEISKSYWGFLPKALKSPFEASKQVTDSKEDLINSLITVVIFALFVPLFMYTSATSMFGEWLRPPFFQTVIFPFFIFILFLGAMVAIIFAVVRLMKAEIDFLLVFTRFATLLVAPTSLVLLSVIFSILNAYFFSSLLLSLALFLASLASIGTIVSIKETHKKDGGIDLIYVIIINYLILFLVIILLGDVLLGDLFNDFSRFMM